VDIKLPYLSPIHHINTINYFLNVLLSFQHILDGSMASLDSLGSRGAKMQQLTCVYANPHFSIGKAPTNFIEIPTAYLVIFDV